MLHYGLPAHSARVTGRVYPVRTMPYQVSSQSLKSRKILFITLLLLVLTFQNYLYSMRSEKTNTGLHKSTTAVFASHPKAEEFSDLFDPQVLSGFLQQHSGGGVSSRAAKCLIKHSVTGFSRLCDDRSATVSICSCTVRLLEIIPHLLGLTEFYCSS